ncbi:hypothetical protein GC170_14440 [bacterium]|nr:hypothetical protein [bacterium]
MASVGKIFVELGLNSSALTRGLSAAAGQIRAFVASPFGGLAAFEAMKLGTSSVIGGVQSIKSFMDQSAFAASDLNEQISATNVQLGDVAGQALDFARNMQAAGQQSFGEALNGITSVTTALMGQGIAQDEAIAKAKELQQRFADLGSQRNMDTGVVAEKFQAMMRGEMNPVESLNVFSNVEKLRSTGKPIGLAAADEFLRQTASAKGDFANTSLSLANLTKQNQVARGGIMGQVGESLAPAYQAAAWFENKFLKAFSDQIMGKLGPAGDRLFNGVFSIGDTILQYTPWIADAFISAADFIASAFQTIGSMIRSPGEYLRLAILQVGVSLIDLVQKVFPKAFADTEPAMRDGIDKARKSIAEADAATARDSSALKATLEAGSQGKPPAPGESMASPFAPVAAKGPRSGSFTDFFKGIILPGQTGAKDDSKRLESIDGSLKTIAATVTGNASPGVKPIGAIPGVL